MTGLVLRIRKVSWFVFGAALVTAVGCSSPANFYSVLAETAGTTVVSTIAGAFATVIANQIAGGQ
jgi:hypothetical protein